MPQLNIYVSKELAERVRRQAEKEHLSISKYVAKLVESRLDRELPWQLEASFGGWTGEWPEITDEIPEPTEPLDLTEPVDQKVG